MINYIGLDDFSEEEKATLFELISHHYKKIRHKDIHKFQLVVHAKKHFKSGREDRTVKYSLNARIDAPHCLITANAFDWNLRKTCHEVMVKLENEFNHKFKPEKSYPKPYYKQ